MSRGFIIQFFSKMFNLFMWCRLPRLVEAKGILRGFPSNSPFSSPELGGKRSLEGLPLKLPF
jgi:hypothetical protein